jgi:hypothetical protein
MNSKSNTKYSAVCDLTPLDKKPIDARYPEEASPLASKARNAGQRAHNDIRAVLINARWILRGRGSRGLGVQDRKRGQRQCESANYTNRKGKERD